MFRLAGHLGRTVAELRFGSATYRPISAHELLGWAAYEEVFGPLDVARRVDIAGAMVTTMIAAVNRGKGKPAPKVADYLIDWDRDARAKEQTPEEMKATLQAIAPEGEVT